MSPEQTPPEEQDPMMQEFTSLSNAEIGEKPTVEQLKGQLSEINDVIRSDPQLAEIGRALFSIDNLNTLKQAVYEKVHKSKITDEDATILVNHYKDSIGEEHEIIRQNGGRAKEDEYRNLSKQADLIRLQVESSK